MAERIAKHIARRGYCSRRDAERLIIAGKVRCNGEILESAALNVDADAEIYIDKVLLPPLEKPRLWRFHKPIGVLVTEKDPQNRPTIFQILPKTLPRIVTIGRLDMNSEGLLLLSNDGELARKLELPGLKRCYRVRSFGDIDQKKLEHIRRGVTIGGVHYRKVEIQHDHSKARRHWFTLCLEEGKNREIRHLFSYIGLSVTRLIRVSYGIFQLEDLPQKALAEIEPYEWEAL